MQENARVLLVETLRNGSHVIKNDEEYKILRDFAETGLVAFGFNFSKKQGEAKLTPLGCRYVESLPGPDGSINSDL